MTDLLGPPWPYPRCPQERSIHVLLTAVKSCASNMAACGGVRMLAHVIGSLSHERESPLRPSLSGGRMPAGHARDLWRADRDSGLLHPEPDPDQVPPGRDRGSVLCADHG